tara:strand:- start:742 stop:1191 length:450 start_codon:yes stop_codon:yes gene_type:complete
VAVNTETTREIIYPQGSFGCHWDDQFRILEVDSANLQLSSECLPTVNIEAQIGNSGGYPTAGFIGENLKICGDDSLGRGEADGFKIRMDAPASQLVGDTLAPTPFKAMIAEPVGNQSKADRCEDQGHCGRWLEVTKPAEKVGRFQDKEG